MTTSTAPASFDPRPLRAAVVAAILFLAAPGSTFGAAYLWTIVAASPSLALIPLIPLIPPSTHALLQLGGGFMSLILAFLALGVPHLLGLDAKSARAIVIAIAIGGVGLALDVVGSLAVAAEVALAGRVVGFAGAVLAVAVLVAARRRAHATGARHVTGARTPLTKAPVPILVVALCAYPLAWAAAVAERLGFVPDGVAEDAMLLVVVGPIVMSMGFLMFSAMLQIEAGNTPRFYAALVAWLAGAVLVVVAHVEPASAVAGAPLLFIGAVLWLASLHGLRRKRGGLTLAATAGAELRVHVVVAFTFLVASPIVWLAAGVRSRDLGVHVDAAALSDVARHFIALGFVFVVTMGVTLRALPRFCRGKPSSPALGLATLALLVLGLALRTARLFSSSDAAPFVRLSAVFTLLAVVVWAGHLLRGLWSINDRARSRVDGIARARD